MNDDSQQDRKSDRHELKADIDIRRSGDHRYRAPILDFSPEGCRVEVPVHVEPGDAIFLSLPGLETIEGKVRWVKNWEAGVQFNRPLYPAVFDMMKERMRRG